MKQKYSITAFVLVFVNLYAHPEHAEEIYCKEEFDISAFWQDGMTWKEFLSIRNELKRPGLIKHVDKIEQQQLAKEAGLDLPKTYIATREKVPIVDLISDLSTYVAKPTHLSFSGGLIIVKNGINLVTGKLITPEQVQEHLYKALEV